MDLSIFTKELLKIPKLFAKMLKQGIKWLFAPQNRMYLLIFVGILILIGIVIFILRKRRKAAKAEAPETVQIEEEASEEEKKSFPTGSLTRIWKSFIKGVPIEFRRSIMLFDHFVVLGDAGVGKSLLIDKYTDWKGQARQFYSSFVQDPLLQVYLGTRCLVQEIPAALLNDSSKYARAALLHLWTPIFKRKPPKIVVAVNGATLTTEHPEVLKKQAQLLRGKINLLAMNRKKPPEISIAMTHMDQVEGMREFFDFLYKNDIPLEIDLSAYENFQELDQCLIDYEAYLSRALTTQSATAYLKTISFLKKSPELFSALARFIKILQHPDPLSKVPQVVHLSLTSDNERDSAISNPFLSTLTPQKVKRFNPHLKHQIAAGVLVVLGAVYLGLGYTYQTKRYQETREHIVEIEKGPISEYDANMHNLFRDFSFSLEKGWLNAFFPDFLPNVTQSIQRRLVVNIRKTYLLPLLHQFQAAGQVEGNYEQILYLFALLYASQENQLGSMVLENLELWKKRLGLPELLITDYVMYSTSTWSKKENAEILSRQKALTRPVDLQPWLFFLNELEKAQTKSFITEKYLASLQQKAHALMDVLIDSDRRKLNLQITRALKKESPLDISTDWLGMLAESRVNQPSIRELLTFFLDQQIRFPSTKNLSFAQLMGNLSIMASPRGEKNVTFSFYLAGKDFTFRSQTLVTLMDRSAMTLFLREFMQNNKWNGGLLFFSDEEAYPDLVIDSSSFLRGEVKIDGRYTRKAFEEEVKSHLVELPELMKRLTIRKSEKDLFATYVTKGISEYAKRYVFGYRHYYDAFLIEADFPGALRYVLSHIQQPTSALQFFLFTIKENTVFEVGDNPFLRPFALELTKFDFFKRLMQEEKGIYPEYEKYKFILAQMQKDIESTQPYISENEVDKAAELKGKVSPLGRIYLSVFRHEKGSYLQMVKIWLDALGNNTEWRSLFQAPVIRTYELGKKEVEETIAMIWEDLATGVRPSFEKFPFRMQADQVVDPAWLKSVISAQGTFWRTFDRYLAPICLKKNGVWQERPSVIGAIKLPEQMLEYVNRIEILKNRLWNDKGEPVELVFSIKPHLLPKMDMDGTVPILSFIMSGKSSVFGFNQQDTWYDFKYRWWEQESAAIGVELASVASKNSYLQIALPDSHWGYYFLLRKAKSVHQNVWNWAITDRSIPKTIQVQFSIKPDPWKLF